MKIIGTTGATYIVEMSQADMAAIVGETYFNSDRCQKALMDLGLLMGGGGWGETRGGARIGATIPLGDRFERLVNLEARHRELQDVSKKLRSMADLMDALGNAVIVPPKQETA